MSAKCDCPTIEIRCRSDQVTDAQTRQIANSLFAQVTLITEKGNSVIWGKHRDDCSTKSIRARAARISELHDLDVRIASKA